jgi:hypothetical protein
MEYYEKRRQARIEALAVEAERLAVKAKFCDLVCSGKLKLLGKPKAVLGSELKAAGFKAGYLILFFNFLFHLFCFYFFFVFFVFCFGFVSFLYLFGFGFGLGFRFRYRFSVFGFQFSVLGFGFRFRFRFRSVSFFISYFIRHSATCTFFSFRFFCTLTSKIREPIEYITGRTYKRENRTTQRIQK